MSQTRPTAEQYLEQKKIKQLLQRLVLSLLENRPDDPEAHIVQILSKSKSEASEELDLWPTLSGRVVDPTMSTVASATVTGRRQSAISSTASPVSSR